MAAAGMLWSTLGLGIRSMETPEPWGILFYRAIAMVVTLGTLVAARNGGAIVRPLTSIGFNGLLSAASLAAASCCMVYALTLTTVAEATLIFGVAPVLAGSLGWLVLREPITGRNWATMGLAALGLVVITQPGTASGSLAGTLLAGGSALGFATFTVFQRRGSKADMLPPVVVAALITMMVSGPLTGPAMSTRDILVALYLGGIVLAGGLALFTAGSKHLRPAELALIVMTEVVFAPLWVWWLFAESMAATTVIGGVVILAAVLIQARVPELLPALRPGRRLPTRRV